MSGALVKYQRVTSLMHPLPSASLAECTYVLMMLYTSAAEGSDLIHKITRLFRVCLS